MRNASKLNPVQLILNFVIARPKLKYFIIKIFSKNYTVYVTLLKFANNYGYNFQIPIRRPHWQNLLKSDPQTVDIWDDLLKKSKIN